MEKKNVFQLFFLLQCGFIVIESRHLSRHDLIEQPRGSRTQLLSSRPRPVHRQEILRSDLQLNPTSFISRRQFRPAHFEYSRGSRPYGTRWLRTFRTPRRQIVPASVLGGDQILRGTRTLSRRLQLPSLPRLQAGRLSSRLTETLFSHRGGRPSRQRLGTLSHPGVGQRFRTRGYLSLSRSPYGRRLVVSGRLRLNPRIQGLQNVPQRTTGHNQQSLHAQSYQIPSFRTIRVRTNSDDDDSLNEQTHTSISTHLPVYTDNSPVHVKIEGNSEGTSVHFVTPNRSEFRTNRNSLYLPSQTFLKHELKKVQSIKKEQGAFTGVVFPEHSFIYQEQPDSNSESKKKQKASIELAKRNYVIAAKSVQQPDMASLIKSFVDFLDKQTTDKKLVKENVETNKIDNFSSEVTIPSNDNVNKTIVDVDPVNSKESIIGFDKAVSASSESETSIVPGPVSPVDSTGQVVILNPVETKDKKLLIDPSVQVDSVVPADIVKLAKSVIIEEPVVSTATVDSAATVNIIKPAESSIVEEKIKSVDPIVKVDSVISAEIVKAGEIAINDPVKHVNYTDLIISEITTDIVKPAESSNARDPGSTVPVESILPEDAKPAEALIALVPVVPKDSPVHDKSAMQVETVKPVKASIVADDKALSVDSIVLVNTEIPEEKIKAAKSNIAVDFAVPVDTTVPVNADVPVDIVKSDKASFVVKQETSYVNQDSKVNVDNAKSLTLQI